MDILTLSTRSLGSGDSGHNRYTVFKGGGYGVGNTLDWYCSNIRWLFQVFSFLPEVLIDESGEGGEIRGGVFLQGVAVVLQGRVH